jgi:hypothetical protein
MGYTKIATRRAKEGGQKALEANDNGFIGLGAFFETSSSGCPLVGLPAEGLLALLPTPSAGFTWKIFTKVRVSRAGNEYLSAYFAQVEIDQPRQERNEETDFSGEEVPF